MDYSTMIDVADTLYERKKVPFRTGHHFASLLTDYGRGKGIFPLDIPYAEAQKIYQSIDNQQLPLSEEELRGALDPVSFIKNRRGIGGPQSSEVQRMLKERREKLSNDMHISQERKDKLEAASSRCQLEFNKLLEQTQ